MSNKSAAIANNDVAILFWCYDKKIPECLGFKVERIDSNGKATVLPAWVGFKNGNNPNWTKKDTGVWPVQKFGWKDLTAPHGKKFKYRITPMIGQYNSLQPSTDANLILTTNEVSIGPSTKGSVKAYFNRGILSTQGLAHELDKKGKPLTTLKKEIANVNSPVRKQLAGDITDALLELLARAKKEGGKCYCALYELTDPQLISELIASKTFVELILSNADTTTKVDGHSKKVTDGENKPFRAKLKKAGVNVITRFVPSGHIGHNKFVVYVKDDKPQAVLTGSTNWTANGMCAQSNNAIIVDSPDIASHYFDYWNRLLNDTKKSSSKQAKALREDNQKFYGDVNAMKVWFSPNTDKAGKPKPAPNLNINTDPNCPLDVKDIFQHMGQAKKSILFLEFQPGYPSVFDKALEIQKKNPKIFVRGAATDAKAVGNYNTALFHGKNQPDQYNIVAASAIKDKYAYWEQELLSAGHAIIHDKIVVIDALTENPVVITGSHNQGYKASYDNDENLLFIANDKDTASAYATHVLDVYDHYRWRYTLASHGTDNNGNHAAFSGLDIDDSWQDKYFEGGAPNKDLTFWS